MGRVLITGASGFLGGAIAERLARDWDVRCARRTEARGASDVCIGEIGPQTDWAAALEGVDAVVHLAGLAHARHSEADLQRVNADGVRRLAVQAREAGVTRFVLMSSVKAAVEATDETPARESDEASPQDPYGRSKRDGELAALSEASLAPVVLRPPLVFAPGARANFAALMRLAASGLPLPFAAINNRRSLISRGSLADAVAAVLAKRNGLAGVFYVADRSSLSTPEIVTELRAGLGMKARLFRAPKELLPLAPRALIGSLEVDDSLFRAAYGTGYAPRLTVREALRATAAAWKKAL